MTDVAQAYATAEEAALLADTALAEIMGQAVAQVLPGVVPHGTLVPYIIVGEHQVIDDDDAQEDDCLLGAELFSTIHILTRPEAPENRQARRIARRVQDILTVRLALAGHRIVVREVEDKQFRTDPDQSTHAILRLRFETEPL